MTELPSVPDNAAEVYAGLQRALGDIELREEEREAISTYIGREIPALLDTRVTSYLVLGSYRDSKHKRLRFVSHELSNRRTDTRGIVLGDTAEMDVDERDLPAFGIKFNLLASAADMITMVMEKESGGEGVELGRIVDGPYFKKSHVLPRDYANFVSDEITTMQDAKKAALEIHFNEKLDDDERKQAIERLAAKVPEDGDVETHLRQFLEEREQAAQPPATYSWVHLSDFRKFERACRCYPWTSEAELREQTQTLPGPEEIDWSNYDP